MEHVQSLDHLSNETDLTLYQRKRYSMTKKKLIKVTSYQSHHQNHQNQNLNLNQKHLLYLTSINLLSQAFDLLPFNFIVFQLKVIFTSLTSASISFSFTSNRVFATLFSIYHLHHHWMKKMNFQRMITCLHPHLPTRTTPHRSTIISLFTPFAFTFTISFNFMLTFSLHVIHDASSYQNDTLLSTPSLAFFKPQKILVHRVITYF